MRIAQAPRSTWREFPDVLIHVEEKIAKAHPDYAAAKAGDIPSAERLVVELINVEIVIKTGLQLQGRRPIVASVQALEEQGENIIPTALGALLALKLGLDAEKDIVQINRVGHTGASGWERLANPALFEGDVESGRDYLLVDDFIGQGGTLANFKGFVERNGGRVVLATTLTGKSYSAKLQPSEETLQRLRAKHGKEFEDWWRQVFGYGFDRLTESEARYLERAENAELIRSRVLAAAQAR